MFAFHLFPFIDDQIVLNRYFQGYQAICTAFHNGAKGMKTVSSIEEAMQLKEKGYPVAAEDVKKCDFADFGNSPFDFTPKKSAEKISFLQLPMVQTVEMALGADEILIGAFEHFGTDKILFIKS